MGLLLYGAGLRLLECAHLRVKDGDLTTNQIGYPDRAAECSQGGADVGGQRQTEGP